MGDATAEQGVNMRRLIAQFDPLIAPDVYRIASIADLANEWTPELKFLLLANTEQCKAQVEALRSSAVDNVFWIAGCEFEVGDVVVPNKAATQASILFRESDTHHALFLTNRCNSYCLMCSQPPTRPDDSWLVIQALDVIRHIRRSPKVLGLSGGEPLLLGTGLRQILDAIASVHPGTEVEVLTNGRLFSQSEVAFAILDGLRIKVRWLVPLYGHADFLHDFVVQTPGAFDETICGLLTLQRYGQSIQLRTVLIEPVLTNLVELCGFIGRNLPFVDVFALMGCEPIGFALANRDLCEVDLADWHNSLSESCKVLMRHRLPFVFMNFPLCALPTPLWSHARKSISDWKNAYAIECKPCQLKNECSGLFSWYESGWKPTKIKAIMEVRSEQIY